MDIPEIAELRLAANQHDEEHRSKNEKEDSDTEPDIDSRPVGYGPRGEGRPLEVGRFEKRRELVDGLGNNSLGKWRPKDRPRPESKKLRAIRDMLMKEVDAMLRTNGGNEHTLFLELAAGRVHENPFSDDYLKGLREKCLRIFDRSRPDARRREGDRQQTISIRLVESILREGDDADASGMSQFAAGVPLGVGVKMPRTPAI